MLRIRLSRKGKKKQPSYRVVVADIEFKRDGRFVENIGWYNPLTDPSTFKIDEGRALHWLSVGAQPSDAVRRLLVKQGTMERLPRLHKGESIDALVAEFEGVTLTDKAADVAEDVQETVAETAESAQETAQAAAATVSETASDAVETVKETAESVSEKVGEVVESAGEAVSDAVETVKETAEDVVEAVSEAVGLSDDDEDENESEEADAETEEE